MVTWPACSAITRVTYPLLRWVSQAIGVQGQRGVARVHDHDPCVQYWLLMYCTASSHPGTHWTRVENVGRVAGIRIQYCRDHTVVAHVKIFAVACA